MEANGEKRASGVVLAPGIRAESLEQVLSPPHPVIWRLVVNGVAFAVLTPELLRPRAMPNDIAQALGVEIKPYTRREWHEVIRALLANTELGSRHDQNKRVV